MTRKRNYTTFDLDTHLKTEHYRSPFSTYLREIVYGGNDGIVTTFAVVAGFAGAQRDPASSAIPLFTVLLFGLANLFADGLSMSLGSFLSLRADQDMYRKEKRKEEEEIKNDFTQEVAETEEILIRKKFNRKDARTMALLLSKNYPYWLEFMMKDELEMPSPENEKPLLIALSTFAAFVVFGFIPLIPYVLSIPSFPLSVSATAGALLLLGILRGVVTRQHVIRAVAETLIIGGLAASAAYIVGTFFRI